MLAPAADSSTRRLPPATTASYDWQRHAACRAADPDVFFGPADEPHTARNQREAHAQAFCQQCPVRTACLRHALTVSESYGIWGGLTPAQRRNHTSRPH